MPKGKKKKSKRLVRFLMSSGSPLTESQKGKLKRELKSGKVKIRNGKTKKAKSAAKKRGARKKIR